MFEIDQLYEFNKEVLIALITDRDEKIDKLEKDNSTLLSSLRDSIEETKSLRIRYEILVKKIVGD